MPFIWVQTFYESGYIFSKTDTFSIFAVSPKYPGGSTVWFFSIFDSQSAAGLWTPPCPSWSFTAGYNRELLPGPVTILRSVPPTGRRPTDLPTWNSAVLTSVRPSSLSGPTSLSFHSSGGRSSSVLEEESRAATTAHLLKVTSSYSSPSSTSSPVPFFSSAHCCLVPGCLACDCASSGFLRARPRRRSRPQGDLAHRW